MTTKDTSHCQPKLSISDAAKFLDMSVQGVHKQLKQKRISCPKMGNKSYITHSIAKQLFSIPFKKKVIVGQIVKGGTGKTTSMLNIASCASVFGAKILLIDADPQANASDGYNIDTEETPVLIDVINENIDIRDCIQKVEDGIDIIPSRIENVVLDNVIINNRLPLHTLFDDLLEPIANDYDFIFIDCPPTIGQAVTAASLYADTILVPLNPDKYSAKGLRILQEEIRKLNKNFKKNINYKVYLNKYSGKTILSEKSLVSLITDPELEGKVLSTTVQITQEIPNLTDSNKNLFSSLKKSSAREDFIRLTKELLDLNSLSNNKQSNAVTPKVTV